MILRRHSEEIILCGLTDFKSGDRYQIAYLFSPDLDTPEANMVWDGRTGKQIRKFAGRWYEVKNGV